MKQKKYFQQVIWEILIMLLLVGCSKRAATHTSEPLPGFVAEFEITFDGNDCIVTGPAELPAGEHTFIFIDRSEIRGELWLLNLDDGKTFQDHLDLQSKPGEWYPKPSWAHYDLRVSLESEELEDRRVDSSTWRLDKVGEHTIICYVSYPQKLWFVAPIIVIEAPSE